jgi:cytochrome c-type biogenesis protein CcmF
MRPGKLFYKRPQQPATSVAIRSTPASDLYIVLASIDDSSGLVTFQVFLTPLVFWLWAGGFIMAFGTLIVMWPNVRERAIIAAAVRAPITIQPESVVVPGGD